MSTTPPPLRSEAEPASHGGAWIGGVGAVLGLLGVAIGALGRHALASRLDPATLDVFETALRYQMIHAVAAVVTAMLIERRPSTLLRMAGGFFVTGTVVFCGSLYLLVLTGQRGLGAGAPIGGLGFMAGWLCLALGFTRRH